MSIGSPATYTADDLLRMPDGDGYELVDGELVELKMSQESSWVAGRIHRELGNTGEESGLGWAFPEGTGFQCFGENRERVRKPDASFILKDRLPEGPSRKGFGRVVPDLVVEVVSPTDLAWEVDSKIEEWLSAGVKVVWQVMPATRSVVVHRSDAEIEKVAADQELILSDLIPDFRIPVSKLFPPQAK